MRRRNLREYSEVAKVHQQTVATTYVPACTYTVGTRINTCLLHRTSLKHTGFAVVTHHGLDYDLVTQVYEEWRKFYMSGQVCL